MDTLWHSVRHALRLLLRAPSFTTAAVLTLGLGIGACTAMYTVVHAVLLAPLPYPDPDRLVHVWQTGAEGGRLSFSDPNYQDVRARSRSLHGLAQYNGARAVVAGGTAPVRARIAIVSREFADVVRIQPVLGRWFVPDEQQPGGRPAAIVSHAFWEQYLARDPDLSRRALTYDGRTYAVVGVMPPEAQFPLFTADLWVPRELSPVLPSRTAHNWRVIGRLKDGVSIEQARADVRAIAAELKRQHGDGTWMVDAAVVPLREDIVGQSRLGLLVLLGGAGFLLLIACANVVNLLLTRAVGRQREVAVRAALGASRAGLLVPFLMESVLLAAAAGGVGLLVASTAVDSWLALEPRGLPRIEEIQVSWPVLAFTVAVAAGCAIVMGLLAGWRATRQVSHDQLREGARTAGTMGTARIRGTLVITQIAVSLVLLAGAGLVIRSVHQLLDQDPGFRTEHVVTMELTTPRTEDANTLSRRVGFYDEVLARLRGLPGVVAAGGVNAFPMSGGYSNGRFLILSPASERWVSDTIRRCGPRPFTSACAPEVSQALGRLFQSQSTTADAEFRVASEDYFRAMGIPLIRGRLFEERDGPHVPHVALISESLAKTRWPGEDPLGIRIQFGNMDGDFTPFTIVGIVGDIRERGLDATPQPTFYGYYRQRPTVLAAFTIAVHGTAEPAWLIRNAQDIVRSTDPDVPPQFKTIEQVVAASIADRRVMMVLLGSFAAAALLIAAIGIYGVISYTVAQRTQEIGVRMALGAQPEDVRRLVLAQGLRVTAIGLAVGLVVAFASTRVLSSLLFGVVPSDPSTYAIVSLLLAAVAAGAAHIPARRATRVDPVVALRSE